MDAMAATRVGHMAVYETVQKKTPPDRGGTLIKA